MSKGFYKFLLITAFILLFSSWLTTAQAANYPSDLLSTHGNSELMSGASDVSKAPALDVAAEMALLNQQTLPRFSCDGTVFHIRDNLLYEIDVSSDAPILNGPIFVYYERMNSLGFNPLDNYLYMITQSADLLRVGQGGTFENLGGIDGINRSYFVGDFLRDGTYVLGNGRTLFLVDISRMEVIDTVSVKLQRPNGTERNPSFSDLAVNPIDGKVYAKDQSTNELITIDLDSGKATAVGPSFQGNSGSVWFDQNGIFYAHSFTGSGDFYRVDTATGAYEWLGNGSTPSAHDATSCPYSFGLELSLDDISCDVADAQHLRMVNRTYQTLEDLSFTQTLPTGFSFADDASTIQSDWRSKFGGSTTVLIDGQTITATGLRVNLGDTDFELNILRENKGVFSAIFRADIANLPSLLGETVQSDDPTTPPQPDVTAVDFAACPTLVDEDAVCSVGYTQLDRYDESVGNGLSYIASFSVTPGTNIRVEGFVAEGHPELGCALDGNSGADAYCTQKQDSENMDILFNGSIIGSYRDGEGANNWENFYLPFGPIDQVATSGNFTLEFVHPDSTNDHSLTTDLVVCAADAGILNRDLGDAPASYGDADSMIVNGIQLGSAVDLDPSAHYSSDAMGDDNNGSDDEDGIDFVGGIDLMVGETGYEVDATMYNSNDAYGNARLQGWIDFDRDGLFDHPAERIGTYLFEGNPSGAKTTTLTYDIPDSADVCGQSTYARFRFTPDYVTPTESALAGETEDYLVNLVCGSISGQVWNDENDDGFVNTNEGPMSVTVTVYNSLGLPVGFTTTDANGNYTVGNLPADTYRVVITGIPATYQPTFDPDGVLDGETSLGLSLSRRNVIANFGYHDTRYDVKGTVWYDQNADGVMNIDGATGLPPEDEAPLPGVTVNLVDSSGSIIDSTTTNADGVYKFLNNLPGEYRIEIDDTVTAGLIDYQLTYDADGSLDGQTYFEITNAGEMKVSFVDLFTTVPEASGETVATLDSDPRTSAVAKRVAQSSEIPNPLETLDFGYVTGDLSIEITADPDPKVALEQDVTWEIRVGSMAPAEGVTVTMTPPASLVSRLITSESPNPPGYSFSAADGWSCSYDTGDPLGNNAQLNCAWAGTYPVTDLSESDRAIYFTMRVPGTFVDTGFVAEALVGATSIDADTDNNRDTAATAVGRSWSTPEFSGDLGVFAHIQYDPVLDLTEREQDSTQTILNPLQVPISITFGLTTTEQPKLTVDYCINSGDPDCVVGNGDAYITGTMIVRSFTITGVMHSEDNTNLLTEPLTVTLGADVDGDDVSDGRAVARGALECSSYTVNCLLPHVEIEAIVASLSDEDERPRYEWQDAEYMVINLLTKGGRDIEITTPYLVEDDSAKPGLYNIQGFVSAEVVFSDYRLDRDYSAPLIAPINFSLRIIAPFVEPEG